MRRLLWKEWNERWIWLLMWALAVIITAALGVGQRGLGKETAQSSWAMLSALFALLAGLGAYGSELVGERATFLYSRALSWKQLFFTKVLLGLAVALLAPVLGAIAFRLAAPAEFHPFMTPAALALGALEMAGISGAAYLIGLGCSIVFPGLAGGLLTILLWWGGIAAIGFSIYEIAPDTAPFFIAVFCLSSPFFAGIVLARFGLTVRRSIRLIRFAMIVLIFAFVGIILDFVPPIQRRLQAWQNDNGFQDISISPSGTFASIEQRSAEKKLRYWLRLADSSRFALSPDIEGYWQTQWTANDCLLIEDNAIDSLKETIKIVWWEQNRLRTGEISTDKVWGPRLKDSTTFVSPDRKRLLIDYKWNMQLFDLQTGAATVIAQLDPRLWKSKDKREREKATAKALDPSNPFAQSWWQSNAQVGYIDPQTGKRVLVDVE
ncbi:MAG: hypothetical protein ACYC7E_06430 [Armatimonadota bacterium]